VTRAVFTWMFTWMRSSNPENSNRSYHTTSYISAPPHCASAMASFSWARVVAKGGALVGGASLLGLVGSTVYTVKLINFQRSRYWSDSFTMTPEALRMPFERVTFHTEDGVSLSGWFVRQTHRGVPSKRLVVCCNPYNHDRSTMLGICRGLWEASYSVLLFNFRSHADEPTRQTIGHLEVHDVRAALNWVRAHKPEAAKIGFLGASMGGAMTLVMAEENRDIVACATDCAFTTLYDVISHRIELEMPFLFRGRPVFREYFMQLINFSNQMWYHYDLRKVGPGAVMDNGESQLKNVHCPLLIVHSKNDSVVPVSCAGDIYDLTSTPESEKEIVILQDVEHIGSYFQDEYRYVKRFVRFFDEKFERVELGDGESVVEDAIDKIVQ
jgi:esterase/lipase